MSKSSRSYERIPYVIVFDDKTPMKETYGGSLEFGILRAHHLKPTDSTSKTVTIFMHPVGGGEYLPLPVGLAKAGHHVIYCNSRYPNNDSALIMEKVALDLGNCIRHAKEKLGYEKVILGGWSGGCSLSIFYQAQAENPTVTHTPAGDMVDLTTANLIPADALLVLAGHMSRAETLTQWIDPSIKDESKPHEREVELDLYNPDNPNQAPYSAEFVERFRAAQIERNRRITKWVKEKLAEIKASNRPYEEHAFTVHGTMADPRWLDPTLDPNGRKPNWCFLGDPKIVNNGPVGLARFTTLRSWLSQWSYDESNVRISNGEGVSIPTLVIGNSADDACTPHHTQSLFESIKHDDKELHEVKGANHYYLFQEKELKDAINIISTWIHKKDLA